MDAGQHLDVVGIVADDTMGGGDDPLDIDERAAAVLSGIGIAAGADQRHLPRPFAGAGDLAADDGRRAFVLGQHRRQQGEGEEQDQRCLLYTSRCV